MRSVTSIAQCLTGYGAADAVDDNIDALAGRHPANAVGETFRGQVDHVFEAELARADGFGCAAGRRNDPGGALCPRKLISRIADRPADRRGEHSHTRLESSDGQRDLRRQVSHWKTSRDYVVDRVGHERHIFGPDQQPFLPRSILTNAVGPGEHHATSHRKTGVTGILDDSSALVAQHQRCLGPRMSSRQDRVIERRNAGGCDTNEYSVLCW